MDFCEEIQNEAGLKVTQCDNELQKQCRYLNFLNQ